MPREVDFPRNQSSDTQTITEGFFEREVYLSSADTASFLRELADAIDDGDELSISGEDWEIPFEYGEPIEVEVEFSSCSGRELEIELEFEEPSGDEGGLGVE